MIEERRWDSLFLKPIRTTSAEIKEAVRRPPAVKKTTVKAAAKPAASTKPVETPAPAPAEPTLPIAETPVTELPETSVLEPRFTATTNGDSASS